MRRSHFVAVGILALGLAISSYLGMACSRPNAPAAAQATEAAGGSYFVGGSVPSTFFSNVILEEGSFWTAADFTENEAEMTERLYAGGGTRATDDLGVSILQGRSVGGGTTVDWMIMLRPGDRPRRVDPALWDRGDEPA